MLYTILYVSRATKKMYDHELDELLIQSKEWNRTHGITGFLAYVEGNLQEKIYHNFIQILEGTKFELKDLFSNIKKDHRHHQITVIKSGTITKRQFQNWDMAFERLDLASLALTKATNADVKSYGQHMVTDHTAAGLEMKNLASGKGWTVPVTLQTKEQQNLDKLSALSGSAFDKEFVNIMVISHQDAVALFEKAATTMGVPDADLRSMASAKLPTLREHLQHATELKLKVNP
jgi:putative membrane protein